MGCHRAQLLQHCDQAIRVETGNCGKMPADLDFLGLVDPLAGSGYQANQITGLGGIGDTVTSDISAQGIAHHTAGCGRGAGYHCGGLPGAYQTAGTG